MKTCHCRHAAPLLLMMSLHGSFPVVAAGVEPES